MPEAAHRRTLSIAMPSITRFAPSPTGLLHEGHAAAALFAWQRAQATQGQATNGQFLLRLEDIDAARCRPEWATAIQQDLTWLGLHWHGPIRIQSQHHQDYQAVLHRLTAENLLYPCFCTRTEIAREITAAASAPHAHPPTPASPTQYPGTCRTLSPTHRADRLAAHHPHAWRLDMQAALARTPPLSYQESGQARQSCNPEPFGDVILARKDTPASYHLCVTHDDALQGITLVTRAEDLRPATALHRLLQTLLGWPEPHYAHHPLIRDAQNRRLAKRDNAPTLRALREAGTTPETILRRAQSALTSPPQ